MTPLAQAILLQLRHATSEANSSTGALWGGSANPDTPLTPKGIADAFRLGERLVGLPVERVWHSGMLRASQTCDGIIRGAEFELVPQPGDPRLEEFNYGKFQGVSKVDTLEALKSEMALRGDDFTFPGGDSFRTLRARVGEWMNERAAASLGGIDLVVGHGHAIRAAISTATGQGSKELFPLKCDNLSLTGFAHVGGRWHCLGNPALVTSRAEIEELLARIDHLS